jgi:hypothetical protein
MMRFAEEAAAQSALLNSREKISYQGERRSSKIS